ncbi:MAG: acetate--CoA ligase family protein, partial [Rubritepida sp.]|nr:acetate--CoA ligase family protein [Rubritepida sp.]
MSMMLSAERPGLGFPGGGFREALLFRPRSVLLRADPALPEARLLARNLAAGGFQGALMIEGLAQEGFAAPDRAPDLAVLAVPPGAQAAALEELAARGCRAVVVPVAAPGLAAMAAAAGVRALGAHSFGLAVPEIGLNATLAHGPVRHGKLALMAQSSAVARAVLDWAAAEGLGFTHIIGVGANDDLGFAAGLDWLARDATTACVLLELRRIKQRRLFISAARAVARTRPVLALRPGALAEDPSGVVEAVMEAALRRAGVLRAAGLEDWLAAAETLARVRPRAAGGAGDRVAIVANGLGVARLGADAALREGLRLAAPGAASAEAIAPLLPPGGAMQNPLSLGTRAGAALVVAARALAVDPGVDVVVALHAPEDEPPPLAARTEMARGARGAPILFGWTGEASARAERAALSGAGLPTLPTPEAALRGAAHLAAERRNRAAAAELPPADVLDVAPERARVRALLDAARAEGRLALYEDEALAAFAAYGIPVAETRKAATPVAAGLAAHAMGPPLVLKARVLLAHKSEVGGVMLGLAEQGAVRAAAEAMATEIACRAPGAAMAGFLVQRQTPRGGTELRLRAGDDAMFGPWIGFGQGGTAADLARDEAFDLPPLNLPLARALIARTRLSRLLPG